MWLDWWARFALSTLHLTIFLPLAFNTRSMMYGYVHFPVTGWRPFPGHDVVLAREWPGSSAMDGNKTE